MFMLSSIISWTVSLLTMLQLRRNEVKYYLLLPSYTLDHHPVTWRIGPQVKY